MDEEFESELYEEEYEPTETDLEDAEREYYEALLDDDFWPEDEREVDFYDDDYEFEELD